MPSKPTSPNPSGKHGKPFTLAPATFDDAIRKILAAPPEPKPTKPTNKKQAKHKR